VSRNADEHYPVLVSNNGKVPLNESVSRRSRLHITINNLMDAIASKDVDVVEMSHADFRAKFPAFARNLGGKKKTAAKKK
jgi:hypothetical protein